MTKLLIIPGSRRVRKEPKHPIPAIERLHGGFVRQLSSYYNRLKDVDVLILSPVYGLISADEKIKYEDPIDKRSQQFNFSPTEKTALRESSLAKLRAKFTKTRYDEVYVNLGKTFLEIIAGFEKMLPEDTRVVYSRGTSMGLKMRHMANWLQENVENHQPLES